jgi:SPP1 family predicted phage head-tail adaptor
MMRAGKMRHRVTIQKPVESQNTYGEPEVRWQNVATAVQCSIEPLRGREYFSSRQDNSEVDSRIEMRFRNDISAKQKIVHGPACACNTTALQEFYIEGVINVMMRNRTLHLMCNSVIT